MDDDMRSYFVLKRFLIRPNELKRYKTETGTNMESFVRVHIVGAIPTEDTTNAEPIRIADKLDIAIGIIAVQAERISELQTRLARYERISPLQTRLAKFEV